MPRTRFAPTPSGYLHLGNAWSFVLTWLLARGGGGQIHLRIDDLDAARLRPADLEDVFASLRWLGLDWDGGPRDPADFLARHSQRLRLPAYREALARLAASGAVYACTCSRQQVRSAAAAAGTPGAYPGTCRELGRDLATPGAAWRLALAPGDEVVVRDLVSGEVRAAARAARPEAASGERHLALDDVVVRQRNGDPSYHLASVVDDDALGIDLVVRGRDLLPSTAIQLALARRLGATAFLGAAFVHHGLVVTAEAVAAAAAEEPGRRGDLAKLSKSAGDRPRAAGDGESGRASLRALRERHGTPARLYAAFARLLGLEPAGRERVDDLLDGFAADRIPAGPIRWEELAL